MLPSIEILPDGECFGIVFQLGVGDGLLDAIFDICPVHLIIIERVYSF
jgi:hypothetical protein